MNYRLQLLKKCKKYTDADTFDEFAQKYLGCSRGYLYRICKEGNESHGKHVGSKLHILTNGEITQSQFLLSPKNPN